MTVKGLIARLEKFDGDMQIRTLHYNGNYDEEYATDIENLNIAVETVEEKEEETARDRKFVLLDFNSYTACSYVFQRE